MRSRNTGHTVEAGQDEEHAGGVIQVQLALDHRQCPDDPCDRPGLAQVCVRQSHHPLRRVDREEEEHRVLQERRSLTIDRQPARLDDDVHDREDRDDNPASAEGELRDDEVRGEGVAVPEAREPDYEIQQHLGHGVELLVPTGDIAGRRGTTPDGWPARRQRGGTERSHVAMPSRVLPCDMPHGRTPPNGGHVKLVHG